MVCESDKNKVFAVDEVKRVSINFFFFSPSMKQHLLVMFGEALAPPQV